MGSWPYWIGFEIASDNYGYLAASETVYETGTGTTDALLDADGSRLAVKTGGVVRWLVFDLHGSVAALCPAGSTTLTDAYRYDPWGQLSASGTAVNPWKYRGLLDLSPNATALLDMGARFYSPHLGAFASEDSVRGTAADPLSMNRYLYAAANPATLVDPDGHAPIICGDDICQTNIDPQTALAMNHETTVAAQTYCQANPSASTCQSQSFGPLPSAAPSTTSTAPPQLSGQYRSPNGVPGTVWETPANVGREQRKTGGDQYWIVWTPGGPVLMHQWTEVWVTLTTSVTATPLSLDVTESEISLDVDGRALLRVDPGSGSLALEAHGGLYQTASGEFLSPTRQGQAAYYSSTVNPAFQTGFSLHGAPGVDTAAGYDTETRILTRQASDSIKTSVRIHVTATPLVWGLTLVLAPETAPVWALGAETAPIWAPVAVAF
jgi:RHS repeat-associated protein